MSLKDRLNTQEPVKKESPKYYVTSEEYREINSLGVLDDFLIDDDINSIFVNGAKNIYVEKKGKIQKSSKQYRDNVQLENIIRRNAQELGVELNNDNPYFEFNQKEGVNVVATLPPLSNPASIYVKYYKDKFANFLKLQEEASISKEMMLFFETLFLKPMNVLITGKKNSLKTTFLSALSKIVPHNYRCALVDYKQEVKLEQMNFTNYDLSKVNDFNLEMNILSSVVSTRPDFLFINDINVKSLAFLNRKMLDGYKGIFSTLTAQSPKEAMDKVSLSILSFNPNLSLETAKILAYQSIDYIVHTTCDEKGRRKISSVNEVRMDLDDTYSIVEIFSLDPYQVHKSRGITPSFYKDLKTNVNINLGIFEENYNHTYLKTDFNEENETEVKSVNVDILNKFKNDLQKENLDNNEIIKNAQNKLEELRRNAQNLKEENQEIGSEENQIEQNENL